MWCTYLCKSNEIGETILKAGQVHCLAHAIHWMYLLHKTPTPSFFLKIWYKLLTCCRMPHSLIVTQNLTQILSRVSVSGWLQNKFIQPYLFIFFFSCVNRYLRRKTHLCHIFTYMLTYSLYTCTVHVLIIHELLHIWR